MTRRTRITAGAIALAALLLYTVTLAPGLLGFEDTPKFQFIGRILGTAHNPGYPLYVMVSYVFSWLPLGNVAWRINLMSALFGALTCGLLVLCVVELTQSVLLGAAAGLALATGGMFWSAATVAEVYTLHACLVTAMTWCLLVWRRTGHDRWFFAGIACFSLGLGHHTSIVTVGPAVAAFAIATRPRFALAPRTIALILGLFALGFSQYLFVLIRTHQGAYLESKATDLWTLAGVIRGSAWEGDLRPLSRSTVATYLPGVWNTMRGELTDLGLSIAALGALALAWRDRAMLMLTFGAALGVIGFAVVFPGQTMYFLLPAYVMAWLLVSAGLDGLSRIGGERWRRAGVPLCSVALVLLAAAQGRANFEPNDRSHQRFHMRYFDALVAQLPERAALVGEDWLVERMVLYERFINPAFVARGLVNNVATEPQAAAKAVAEGHPLFAFVKGAERLRPDGVDFDATPFPMTYGPLRQFLDDQPRGTLVALAVPAGAQATLANSGALPADLRPPAAGAQAWSNLSVLSVLGRGTPVVVRRPQTEAAFASVGSGSLVPTTTFHAPHDIVVESTWDHAAIRVGGREMIGSTQPVLARWSPSGTFLGAQVLSGDGVVPMPDSPVSLFQLRTVHAWRPMTSDTADLTTDAASGHLFVRPVTDTSLVLYAARRLPLEPHLFEGTADDAPALVERVGTPAELIAGLRADGWPIDAASQLTGAYVYRIALPPSARVRQLNLGGVPDVLLARWGGTGRPPEVYGRSLTEQLEVVDSHSRRLHMERDHHQLFLARGWSPVVNDPAGPGGLTATTGSESELVLPISTRRAVSIDMQLRPSAAAGTVAIAVNGIALPTQTLSPGWHRYRWQVAPGAARDGMNAVVIHATAPISLADVVLRE